MKTPEDIKKGLKCHSRVANCDTKCYKCDCFIPGFYGKEVYSAALEYIQQLESRLAQVERERDAAVGCIEKVYKEISKPVYKVFDTERNLVSSLHIIWDYLKDWRGVCEENTKDGADV